LSEFFVNQSGHPFNIPRPGARPGGEVRRPRPSNAPPCRVLRHPPEPTETFLQKKKLLAARILPAMTEKQLVATCRTLLRDELVMYSAFASPQTLSRTPEESGKRPGGHDHGDANLPRASINIEGKEFVALIDTGATHNIIRREAVTGQMKPLDQPAQLQTASRHRSLPSSHRRHPGT
jgi:hypothetical protein